jgi:hypothetical protein
LFDQPLTTVNTIENAFGTQSRFRSGGKTYHPAYRRNRQATIKPVQTLP